MIKLLLVFLVIFGLCLGLSYFLFGANKQQFKFFVKLSATIVLLSAVSLSLMIFISNF